MNSATEVFVLRGHIDNLVDALLRASQLLENQDDRLMELTRNGQWPSCRGQIEALRALATRRGVKDGGGNVASFDYDPADRRYCSNCHAHPAVGRECVCSDETRAEHEAWRKSSKPGDVG